MRNQSHLEDTGSNAIPSAPGLGSAGSPVRHTRTSVAVYGPVSNTLSSTIMPPGSSRIRATSNPSTYRFSRDREARCQKKPVLRRAGGSHRRTRTPQGQLGRHGPGTGWRLPIPLRRSRSARPLHPAEMLWRSNKPSTRTVPIFSSFQSYTVRSGYTVRRLGHVHRYHPHSTRAGRQRVR